MVKLSERLLRIADMVSATENVADIGCDHGYLSIYLCEKKGIKNILACDVVEGPLSRARAHIAECGLQDKIECRLSDGFKEITPGEIKSAVIAGMGGSLISKIIAACPETIESLEEIVISPQSEVYKARTALFNQGFYIDREDFVLDEGKYYPIIHATCKATDSIQKARALGYDENAIMEYGPCLLVDRNETLLKYLSDRKDKYQTIIDKSPDNSDLGDVIKKLEVINSIL